MLKGQTAILSCLLLVPTVGVAQPLEPPVPPVVTASAAQTTPAKSTPQMSETQMEKMKELTSPNENHKKLMPFVGAWKYTSKWWMDPAAKPEVASGTSQNRMIFGGRFLQQVVAGTAMGQPFSGVSTIGYDNVKGEYQVHWMDNMGTGMMFDAGKWNDAEQTLTHEGTVSCPMTGDKNMWYRGIAKVIDKNHYTFEMWGKGADGKEFKSMEMAYTRTK